MLIVDTLSRIIHVLTAITLVGGSIFTLFVLAPSAKQLGEETHQKLHGLVMGRWKRYVHLGVVCFLVTGLYNYANAIPLHKGDALYHALMGTKMLLALSVFFLAAALVGRSPMFEGIRRNRSMWMKVLVLLAVVIVSISGFVKVRPSITAPAVDTSTAE